MIANFWALIQLILKIWNAVGIAVGWIKQEVYDHKVKAIDENVKKAGDPELSLEERLKAGKELENGQNNHV